jgi:hypothetical protein
MLFISILQLQHKIERNEASFKFNALTDDIYAVSSLLKVCILPTTMCYHDINVSFPAVFARASGTVV